MASSRKDRGGVGVGAPRGARAIRDMPILSRGGFSKLPSLSRGDFSIFAAGALLGARRLSNRVSMESDEIAAYGPKMAALTEKQRGYVLAMLSAPLGNPTKWARMAGYSDVASGAKVMACRYLAHDDRIMEAAREESERHMHTIGPAVAIGVMFTIARTSGHKDQLRAAEAIANRVGLHELSEHKVTVERTDRTGAAMVERIRALADALGVSADALLGVNAAPGVKVIEGKAEEVEG